MKAPTKTELKEQNEVLEAQLKRLTISRDRYKRLYKREQGVSRGFFDMAVQISRDSNCSTPANSDESDPEGDPLGDETEEELIDMTNFVDTEKMVAEINELTDNHKF